MNGRTSWLLLSVSDDDLLTAFGSTYFEAIHLMPTPRLEPFVALVIFARPLIDKFERCSELILDGTFVDVL
jgi:hypothetical protein